MIPTIHPFPARMAPELALSALKELKRGSLVLDPMSGSGMVLRQATELGLHSIGFDMDPLAVLMATVWTTAIKATRSGTTNSNNEDVPTNRQKTKGLLWYLPKT